MISSLAASAESELRQSFSTTIHKKLIMIDGSTIATKAEYFAAKLTLSSTAYSPEHKQGGGGGNVDNAKSVDGGGEGGGGGDGDDEVVVDGGGEGGGGGDGDDEVVVDGGGEGGGGGDGDDVKVKPKTSTRRTLSSVVMSPSWP